MQPTGHLRGDAVHVGGDARQRFYDSRGYGRPLDGNEIALSRVETAHLLFRGDLSGVTLTGENDTTHADGEPAGFERFFVDSAATADRFAVRYLVYADLRDRGFYLSPAREPWPGGTAMDPLHEDDDNAIDFVAYERGSTPQTGAVEYRIQVVGERESLPAAELAGRTLAVVDEESDITYFGASDGPITGSTMYEPPTDIDGVLLADRVILWDAPADLYERGFYGQPLTGRAAAVEGAVQLSLVEAAALAADGRLTLLASVDADGTRTAEIVGEAHSTNIGGDAPAEDSQTSATTLSDTTPPDAAPMAAIVARGRAVEGKRFDRRVAAYTRLRERGAVPKTGFKFGADFRTYLDVETADDLPHSEHLVRVVGVDHQFSPRELSLDVRLAGGVRKQMVFALTEMTDDEPTISWLTIGRLTP